VILLDTLLQHDWARDYAQRPNTVVASGVADVLDALESLTATRSELVWA
jgi:DNA processing protein